MKDPSNLDSIILWSASLLCFFGFLHSGEITIRSLRSYNPTVHLNYSDISVDSPANPTIVKIWLKCSKTDPFRNGVDVYVGKTGQALCPVSALLNSMSPFAVKTKVCCLILVTVLPWPKASLWTNEEVSADTFVLARGSYRASTIGLDNSDLISENDFSCSGPHIQACPFCNSSLSGWLISAILEENFPNWFIRPTNLQRSDTDYGGFMLDIAEVFSGSAQMPSLLTTWPRNFMVGLWNSHLLKLRVASAFSRRCKTANNLASCSSCVAPKISVSSTRHTYALQYPIHPMLGHSIFQKEACWIGTSQWSNESSERLWFWCYGDLPEATISI